MPIMCVIQMPEGKDQAKIEKCLVDVSRVIMEDLESLPNQVRVTIEELPKNRYSAGGVMGYDIPGFNPEKE